MSSKFIFFLVLENLPLFCCGPLPPADKPAFPIGCRRQQSKGDYGGVLRVLSPQGPEQLEQEGGKGAQCTERAFLTVDRKNGARQANTRAVVLVQEAVVLS